MPRSATLSLRGLFQWDNSIMDGLTPPDGVDKEGLINWILWRTTDFEILYPDPVILKIAISDWAKTRAASWERAWRALTVEYSPLENYDRIEEWTDNGGHSLTRGEVTSGRLDRSTENSQSGTNKNTQDTTADSDGQVDTSSSGGTETGVAGFNQSAGYADSNRTTTEDTGYSDTTSHSHSVTTDNGSTSGTGESSEIESHNGNNDITETGTTDNIRKGRAHGNIGVTTSQAMLMEELEVSTISIYNLIASDFEKEFCLLVY